MNITKARKVTTLGVGLALLAGGLATAAPASADTCYTEVPGYGRFEYECRVSLPPDLPITPPPPVVVQPPAKIATTLALLTKGGNVGGQTSVGIATRLTDLAGHPLKSKMIALCWKAYPVGRESCTGRATDANGVAAVAIIVNTAMSGRGVANNTATSLASASASAIVRVTPRVNVAAGVRIMSVALNPSVIGKVVLQKQVGKGYVNIRTTLTSARGTIGFNGLIRGAYYRVYLYASGGRNASVSRLVRV
jgi:hypothetical protein